MTDTLEDLRRRNAELVEAVNARDSFLAIAVHELRNPMTPIVGQVEMLLQAARSAEGITSQRLIQGLEKLAMAVRHFQNRAGTLLDVSRLNAGMLRLDVEDMDLSALVREIIESYAAAAQYAKSPIEASIADGIHGAFDALAIRQIIDNVLGNAIRYSIGKPIEVSLTSDGTAARVRVQDHGVGISREDQARIFERFERVVGASAGGFGIGLWVVRQLVEVMGGTITVSSTPGKGSTFMIMLPLQSTQDRR
ncbi:MAG TPA: HAMP domain-containing sensor histidine kinase [Micropepsaceae bacterium]|nr:HAMP domain-containing sensor histidine kinase [Micropepsaceae bacterium]